jgi:hypothetical protein
VVSFLVEKKNRSWLFLKGILDYQTAGETRGLPFILNPVVLKPYEFSRKGLWKTIKAPLVFGGLRLMALADMSASKPNYNKSTQISGLRQRALYAIC